MTSGKTKIKMVKYLQKGQKERVAAVIIFTTPRWEKIKLSEEERKKAVL